MAIGKRIRTDVLRSLFPPCSRTESTRQHIAADRRFKKLSRDESTDFYVVWITHHKFKPKAIYIYDISNLRVNDLTLILLTWRKWSVPNNASK
jgi:hypothetical protein